MSIVYFSKRAQKYGDIQMMYSCMTVNKEVSMLKAFADNASDVLRLMDIISHRAASDDLRTSVGTESLHCVGGL